MNERDDDFDRAIACGLLPSSPIIPPDDLPNEQAALEKTHSPSGTSSHSDQQVPENRLRTGGSHPSEYSLSDSEEYEATSAPDALVQKLATTKRLKTESIHELRRFSKASPRDRDMMMFASIMSIHDKLNTAEKAWSPSPDHLLTIRKYSIAILLSTKSSGFKVGARQGVADLLRKMGGGGLPDDWETCPAKLNRVSKAISAALTIFRSEMKAKVAYSKEVKTNIAELTDDILAPAHNLKPTAELWARMALVRGMFKDDVEDSKFWDNVDTKMKDMREEAKKSNPTDVNAEKRTLHRMFVKGLEFDYKQYGNPASGGSTLPTPDSQLDQWQITVEETSAAIAGNDSEAPRGSRRRKRTRNTAS
ncbi:hypothetical protein BV25DRAFT_1843590 [Artomyces pyxidatus]|uniref:Uncharacterized protein n=1 Tax=Artomyces pyxidatus TaxID=48021 RepID=A0ACB8SE86_9AGAM|nr:hypothetical protein BV25DRAFT_1843590 [Artomyces pyxidatus]